MAAAGVTLAAAAWLGVVRPALVQAQLNALNATEQANVKLALDNLRRLLDDWRAVLQNQPAPRSAQQAEARRRAEAELAEHGDVLTNLRDKLARGRIRSVPGLRTGTPARYRHGNDARSPRAAYCDDQTFVRDGDQWVPCTPGDIIVDHDELEPTPGQPIDPTTPRPAAGGQRWGWTLKWALLHILVHEKFHEIMVNRQVQEELKRHAGEPEAQRQLHLELARRNAATPERHAEVYEGQKRLLRLYGALLRRQRQDAARARPPDRDRVRQLDDQIQWIRDEIRNLEQAMRRAVGDHEFTFDTCGYPGALHDGTLGLYVTKFGGFWRMDVDVRNAKRTAVRLPLTQWFGVVNEEDAIPREPNLYAVMPQEVFSGLHVQADACAYLAEATNDGRIQVAQDQAALALLLPPAEPPVAEEEQAATPQSSATLVGVVLPADMRPGDTVSGAVTTDPAGYRDVPALQVIELKALLPTTTAGTPDLGVLQVDLGDGRLQPADQALTLAVPAAATRVRVTVRRGDEPAPIVARDVPVSRGGGAGPPPGAGGMLDPRAYRTPSLYVPDEVRVIQGPFDGDSRTTAVEVGGTPCRVMAETPRAAYWTMPATVQPGAHDVHLTEPSTRATFSVVVLGLTMRADQLELVRGQSTGFDVEISGPHRLPEHVWRAATPFDVVDLAGVRKLAPGFRIPSPGDPGVILVVIRNASPQTIAIDGAKNDAIVLTLGQGAFAGGPYRYHGTIRSRRSGGFSVRATVVAFVAPVGGVAVR